MKYFFVKVYKYLFLLLLFFLMQAQHLSQDNLPPAQNPPHGLLSTQVPLLVAFGIDDNAYSGLVSSQNLGGLKWIYDYLVSKTNPKGKNQPGTFDGQPARATFFITSSYLETGSIDECSNNLKWLIQQLYKAGHEIGNHTDTHTTNEDSSLSQWQEEITTCLTRLTKPAPT